MEQFMSGLGLHLISIAVILSVIYKIAEFYAWEESEFLKENATEDALGPHYMEVINQVPLESGADF